MPEGSKDNPQQILKARLDEQLAKSKMMLSGLMEIGDKNLTKEAIEFGKLMEFTGQVQADSSWVTSMMEARIPYETVLKVWDLKDQQRRDSKNPQDPQNK